MSYPSEITETFMKFLPDIDAVQNIRSTPTPTLRASSPELEDILFRFAPVLDHGFLRVIDYMGNDEAIVQAARVSYGRGTSTKMPSKTLIRYLMRHRHTSPFEMCEIKFHIKMPIFIARQWLRHRMASVNEYSARYSILDAEFYIPEPEHLCVQSQDNKQGRGEVLDHETAMQVIDMLKRDAANNYVTYNKLLDEDGCNLSRELARINLTLNTYTQMYWKIDLHNLLHFIGLRSDSHAQYEIRAYSDLIAQIVSKWTPLAYGAFADYRQNAFTLSGPMLKMLNAYLTTNTPQDPKSYGLSSRETKELLAAVNIPVCHTPAS